MKKLLALAAGAAALAGVAAVEAAERPDRLDIGITTFLTGPASVFGEPGRAAAEVLIAGINEQGGIDGVPLAATYIDEGAGAESMISEYRRLVENEGYQVMFGSISSGSCNTIAPLAEDLQVLNIMWDCGTQRIFEEHDYRYVFRTQAHATAEMVSTLLYLLKVNPDFRTIAVINQDYAWGRDSWDIFSRALRRLHPEARVVAELFPRFGAPDYSTEISRLSALRPDVILSTSWGGDLDTFVRQAAERGLMQQSLLVLPLAESSLERLGGTLPEGVIVGARGDHYFLHPEYRDDPEHLAFVESYRERTGAYPIYPTYHMAQALAALKAAYEKAIEANGGEWPEVEQVAEAMIGLEFRGFGDPLVIREDHQALETQLLGTTMHSDDYPFAVIGNVMLFPGELVTTPVGMTSEEWLETLEPAILDSDLIRSPAQ